MRNLDDEKVCAHCEFSLYVVIVSAILVGTMFAVACVYKFLM